MQTTEMPPFAEAAAQSGGRRHAYAPPSSVGSRLPLPFARTVARRHLALLLFSGATAIVALHAAVDSFIAPEPGTGPGDHLLRGSASLALLAVAAVVYPRLPAGGRAALAAGARRSRPRRSGARDRGRPRRRRPRRGLDGLPAPPGRARRCSGSPRPCSGARASRAGSATCAVPGSRSQPCSRPTGSSSRSAIGDPRHAPAARGRRAGRPRAAVRGGDAPDERRPRPRRLVRPLPQRRRRDLVPDPAGQARRRRGCSSATATACSCSTPAATTEARATRTSSAGPAPRTSTPPSPGCSDGQT